MANDNGRWKWPMAMANGQITKKKRVQPRLGLVGNVAGFRGRPWQAMAGSVGSYATFQDPINGLPRVGRPSAFAKKNPNGSVDRF